MVKLGLIKPPEENFSKKRKPIKPKDPPCDVTPSRKSKRIESRGSTTSSAPLSPPGMVTNAFLNWLALRRRRRHNLGRQRYFWASVNLSFLWVQVTIPINVIKSTTRSKYVATTTCSTGSKLRLRRKRKLWSYAWWFKPTKPRRRKEESPTEKLYLRHQQVSLLRMSLFSKESTNNSVPLCRIM